MVFLSELTASGNYNPVGWEENPILDFHVLIGVHFWSRKSVKSTAVFVAPPPTSPLSILRLSSAKFKYFTQKFTPLSKPIAASFRGFRQIHQKNTISPMTCAAR